ncbi:hypothetical protein ACP70R_023589 [Stipagrostis hirtigluma subsp. patula]
MALSFAEQLLHSLVKLVFVLLFFIYIKSRRSKNNLLVPTDGPIVGILPSILANLHGFHDFCATILADAEHNFRLRGPPGTGLRLFMTCDPANVRHIFTTNFPNYPKGDEFAVVFPVLGGTIFTADGEPWRRQRARIQQVLKRPELREFMAHCCRHKVEGGLVPLLSRMASTGTPFDMEDMLGRLVFDMTVMLVFGEDPASLSGGMPPVPIAAALDVVMEVAFYRHVVPTFSWKVMRWLNIGMARKLAAAESALRGFVADMIQRRMAGRRADGDVNNNVDILSLYLNDQSTDYVSEAGEPTDFLYRTFINFMVALRDPVGAALPWLVYNLATNPRVVSNVRRELELVAARKSGAASSGAVVIFETAETKGLVYLRAALFESLRLYPPGPMERKAVLADDVLPSGHEVRAGETVLVSVYSMGRMESVWGEDCREYRPERWLLEDADGGVRLRYVPSYKFLSFNTGPRSCLEKNIAVEQITSVAATVLWNFDVAVEEGHAVEPKLSAVLQMNNGLMATVKKREEFL